MGVYKQTCDLIVNSKFLFRCMLHIRQRLFRVKAAGSRHRLLRRPTLYDASGKKGKDNACQSLLMKQLPPPIMTKHSDKEFIISTLSIVRSQLANLVALSSHTRSSSFLGGGGGWVGGGCREDFLG